MTLIGRGEVPRCSRCVVQLFKCIFGQPERAIAIARQCTTLRGMYESHPSLALHALFRAKPYQGAAPEKARFVVVGLDANYARDAERSAPSPSLRSTTPTA